MKKFLKTGMALLLAISLAFGNAPAVFAVEGSTEDEAPGSCNNGEHYSTQEDTENVVSATCTTPGSYDIVVRCKECKAVISRQTVTTSPALGHTAGEAVKENEKAATCTEAGSYDNVVYCTVCKSELSREPVKVNALGHTAGAAVKENVTSAGGYDLVQYCTVCKAEIPGSRKSVSKPKLKEQAITITKLSAIYKVTTVKKASKFFSIGAKAKTSVKAKKISGSKKITVSSKGKVQIAKGTKKGTYTARVKLTANATSIYKAATKTVKVTVKVK